jgi:hypothetical protein
VVAGRFKAVECRRANPGVITAHGLKSVRPCLRCQWVGEVILISDLQPNHGAPGLNQRGRPNCIAVTGMAAGRAELQDDNLAKLSVATATAAAPNDAAFALPARLHDEERRRSVRVAPTKRVAR